MSWLKTFTWGVVGGIILIITTAFYQGPLAIFIPYSLIIVGYIQFCDSQELGSLFIRTSTSTAISIIVPFLFVLFFKTTIPVKVEWITLMKNLTLMVFWGVVASFVLCFILFKLKFKKINKSV